MLIFYDGDDFVNTRVNGRTFLSVVVGRIWSKSLDFVRISAFFDRDEAYLKKWNKLAELVGVK